MLRYFVPPGCSKTSSHTLSKGAIDFEGLTARLKPRPFKNKVRTRVFPQPAKARVFIGPERRLLEAHGSQLEARVFRSWDNATVETGLARACPVSFGRDRRRGKPRLYRCSFSGNRAVRVVFKITDIQLW